VAAVKRLICVLKSAPRSAALARKVLAGLPSGQHPVAREGLRPPPGLG